MGKGLLFVLLGILLIYVFFTVGLPFTIALLFAVLLEPLIQWLRKVSNLRRPVVATGVATVFTVLFFGFLYLLGAKIVTQLLALYREFFGGGYVNATSSFIRRLNEQMWLYMEGLPAPFTTKEVAYWLQNALTSLFDQLNTLLKSVASLFLNVAGLLPNMLIVLIVFFIAFFLFTIRLPDLKGQFLSLFDDTMHEKVEVILDHLKAAIVGFIRAQLMISTLTYMITLAGLLILQVKYPLAIALLIILVDILPILGTGAVIVPWAVFEFVTGDLFTGTGLLILYLVITVFRRVIEPKILGNSLGIGALSALISMYLGFKLLGLAGLFLGPILVIIYRALRSVGLLEIKLKF
ncbi:sporulation integral membrane protein YtvI [Bacillaceae bacterium]